MQAHPDQPGQAARRSRDSGPYPCEPRGSHWRRAGPARCGGRRARLGGVRRRAALGADASRSRHPEGRDRAGPAVGRSRGTSDVDVDGGCLGLVATAELRWRPRALQRCLPRGVGGLWRPTACMASGSRIPRGRRARWVALFGTPLWIPGSLLAISVLFAFYPDGRLPGRHWRLPVAAAVLGIAHADRRHAGSLQRRSAGAGTPARSRCPPCPRRRWPVSWPSRSLAGHSRSGS